MNNRWWNCRKKNAFFFQTRSIMKCEKILLWFDMLWWFKTLNFKTINHTFCIVWRKKVVDISKQYIWIPFVYIISSSSLAITLAFIEKTLNRMSCTLIQHLSVVLWHNSHNSSKLKIVFPMRMCNLHSACVLGSLI